MYDVVLVPPPHAGGRRQSGERGRCLLCPQMCIPAWTPGQEESGSLGMQHFGARSSLRVPSTALLLIGADRAEERERDKGRHGENKVMVHPGTGIAAWQPLTHNGVSATPGLGTGQAGSYWEE